MRTSVKITDKAKNSTFDGCTIYGGIENSGKNTNFKKTTIGLGDKVKSHPIIYSTIASVVGGVILFYIVRLLNLIS